jgi:hypothetical protein
MGYVARIEDMRNAYSFRERPTGRRAAEYKCGDWINLAEVSAQWRGLVNTIVKPWVA